MYLLLEQLASPPRCRYRAFDPRLREFRTLLCLPADAVGRKHLAALRRASTSNDSLPKIIDSVKDGDEHWLVLTWVNGLDVREYLKRIRSGRTARPSSREVIRLLRGLAHGLRHLHNNCQLIHGDQQPANIILQSRPTRLVTIDFGSAWLREASSMRDSGDGMSAVYAPPELQGNETLVDFRGDQFSASLIAYELLTLKIPYADLGGKAGLPVLIDRVGIQLVSPSKHSPDAARLPKSVRQGKEQIAASIRSRIAAQAVDNPGHNADRLIESLVNESAVRRLESDALPKALPTPSTPKPKKNRRTSSRSARTSVLPPLNEASSQSTTSASEANDDSH